MGSGLEVPLQYKNVLLFDNMETTGQATLS